VTEKEFSYLCGYESEYHSLKNWGCGIKKAIAWLVLIQEDHSYTFKTVEQRFQKDANGCIFDPNAHLPYGP